VRKWHPGGVPERWEHTAGTPSGCNFHIFNSGGFADAQPPATVCDPFGINDLPYQPSSPLVIHRIGSPARRIPAGLASGTVAGYDFD